MPKLTRETWTKLRDHDKLKLMLTVMTLPLGHRWTPEGSRQVDTLIKEALQGDKGC